MDRDTMRQVTAELQVPARGGNTCYRPSTDSGQLRTVLHDTLSNVDPDVELRFEEVLLTEADDPDDTRLLINDRSLAEWANELDPTARERFESKIKPALASGRFGILENDNFLDSVLELILEND